jgi:hypothetical protein
MTKPLGYFLLVTELSIGRPEGSTNCEVGAETENGCCDMSGLISALATFQPTLDPQLAPNLDGAGIILVEGAKPGFRATTTIPPISFLLRPSYRYRLKKVAYFFLQKASFF